MTSYRC